MLQAMGRRHGRATAMALLLLVLIAACSSGSSHPAELGSCVPAPGSSCSVTPGGSSSGASTDAGSCAAYADASACDACAASSCCPALETCIDNAACANLDGCEIGCNGSSACITACQGQYPTGQGDLTVLFDCLAGRCPVCAQSGVGDPCSSSYPPCETGLVCNGDWCTKACARSSDCAGLGTGGTNGLGEPNTCVMTSSGYVCAPGCNGPGCSYFPATYCASTSAWDGSAVMVCAALPDAGGGHD